MRKGQLTIEFLIILIVMVLLFTGISLDLIGSAVDDSTYIQASQLINSANFLITTTQKDLLLQGAGATKSVLIHAPKKCDFIFDTEKIEVDCGEYTEMSEFSGMILGIQNSNVKYTKGIIAAGRSGRIDFYKS